VLSNTQKKQRTSFQKMLSSARLHRAIDVIFFSARCNGTNKCGNISSARAGPDGRPFSFENEKLKDEFKGFKSGKVFGVPLVSITNANDVESKIINKLLNLLKNGENGAP
jgi:hypothetical protein